jgi:hypothetical protein
VQEHCPHLQVHRESGAGNDELIGAPNNMNDAIKMQLWDKELDAFIKGWTQFA